MLAFHGSNRLERGSREGLTACPPESLQESRPGAQPSEMLERALSCYLHAMKLGDVSARQMVPRMLHALTFEDKDGKASRAFERTDWWVRGNEAAAGWRLSLRRTPLLRAGCCAVLNGTSCPCRSEFPVHVFLPWLSSMAGALSLPEGRVMKAILKQMAVSHPQPVFLAVRHQLYAMHSIWSYSRRKVGARFCPRVLVCTCGGGPGWRCTEWADAQPGWVPASPASSLS